MPITLSDANDYAQHFLGGTPVGETLTGLSNEAGRELMNMAGWLWAEAVVGTADFVQDDDSAELPAAFLRFTSTPRLSGGVETRLELVSVNRLETLRAGTDGGGDPYYAAVFHEDDGTGLVLPRLGLYPTPNAAATPGITFTYAAGWADLSDDADILPIPTFLEPLYKDVLRAVSRGFEDDLDNPGRKQQYLEIVRAGQTLRGARETDRALQQSFGTMRGGVGSSGSYGRSIVTLA